MANDGLVFPDIDDLTPHTAFDDFAAGTAFGPITIGEPGGLFAAYGTGTSTINLATNLSSSFPSTVSVQDGETLVLGGEISGSNGISKAGSRLVLPTQSNSYTDTDTATTLTSSANP